MIRLAILIALMWTSFAAANDPVVLKTAVLRVEAGPPQPLSRLDLPAADDGLAGAAVGLADNNTTGRFLGQSFEMSEAAVAPDNAISAAEAAVAVPDAPDGDSEVSLLLP